MANVKAPETTVAQDIMAPQPQMPPQMGMPSPEMPPQMPPQAPQMGMPSPEMGMPAMADGGLASLPVPDDMFPDEYAGGGVVAFAAGDLVQDGMFSLTAPEEGPLSRRKLVERLTLPELQMYNRTGKLPDRLRGELGGHFIEGTPIFGNVPLTSNTPEFLQPAAPKGPAPSVSPVPDAAPPTKDKKSPRQDAAAPATGGSKVGSGGDMLDSYRAALIKGGVSPDPLAEDRKASAAAREALAKDREEAKYAALLQAGLGMMAGKSPYALENIGRGAQAGLAEYSRSKKELKDEERDLAKIDRDMRRAEEAMKRGDVDRAYDLYYKAKTLEAQVASANKPSQFKEQYDIYSADERAAGRKPSFEGFRKSLGSGDDNQALNRVRYADAALANSLDYMRLSRSDKPEDKQKAEQMRRDVYTRYGVTSGGGVPPDISDILKKYQ